MTTLLSKLVGMNFYRHATAISKLIRDDAVHPGPLPVLLVREPENPHDKNAIAVYIKIGHIARDKAQILADLYDVPNEHMVENARICIFAKTDVDPTGQLNISTEIPGAS